MTHSYAAKRLLEHGPLSLREFREITGWRPKTAESALRELIRQGMARRRAGTQRYVYELI